MSELIKSLIEQSRAPARNPGKIIFGPPGSGKTEAIVKDIRNIDSERILVLTQTRVASEIIKLKLKSENIWESRFKNVHAACLSEIYKWKDDEYSQICNKFKTVKLLKDIMSKLDIDPELYRPRKIADWISLLKNTPETLKYFEHIEDSYIIQLNMISGEEIIDWNLTNTVLTEFADENYWPIDWSSTLYQILKNYQSVISQNDEMDYDDIQLITLYQFQSGNCSKYYPTTIYIDEISDFNSIQCKLLQTWLNQSSRIFITTDNIYSINNFRMGGDWEDELSDKVTDLKKCNLDPISYRSIESIQMLCSKVPQQSINAPLQTGMKTVDMQLYNRILNLIKEYPVLELIDVPDTQYSPLAILSSNDKRHEAVMVCKIIKHIVDTHSYLSDNKTIKYQDIAICYFSLYHSFEIDRAAEDESIPLLRLQVTDHDIDLNTDIDELRRMRNSDTDLDQDKVRVMSLHTVKGLGVKIIFILGLEDPEYNTGLDSESLTFPLLHIGINRAEQFVILGWAKERDGITYDRSEVIEQLRHSIDDKPVDDTVSDNQIKVIAPTLSTCNIESDDDETKRQYMDRMSEKWKQEAYNTWKLQNLKGLHEEWERECYELWKQNELTNLKENWVNGERARWESTILKRLYMEWEKIEKESWQQNNIQRLQDSWKEIAVTNWKKSILPEIKQNWIRDEYRHWMKKDLIGLLNKWASEERRKLKAEIETERAELIDRERQKWMRNDLKSIRDEWKKDEIAKWELYQLQSMKNQWAQAERMKWESEDRTNIKRMQAKIQQYEQDRLRELSASEISQQEPNEQNPRTDKEGRYHSSSSDSSIDYSTTHRKSTQNIEIESDTRVQNILSIYIEELDVGDLVTDGEGNFGVVLVINPKGALHYQIHIHEDQDRSQISEVRADNNTNRVSINADRINDIVENTPIRKGTIFMDRVLGSCQIASDIPYKSPEASIIVKLLDNSIVQWWYEDIIIPSKDE